MAGALWLLGVRDWRCYVVALTSPVVLQGLIWGNLTLFLLLPVALAWRYRDRAVPAGLAVGAAIAAKVFVFPLLAWLLMTRRFRAAAVAAATAVALVLLPWAVIGFDGFTDYPALMRELQDVYAVRSASLASVFGGGLGVSAGTAVALATAVSLVLVVAAYLFVGVDGGDRRAFALVVAACLLASPIVWSELRRAALRARRPDVAAPRARLALRLPLLARGVPPQAGRGRPGAVLPAAGGDAAGLGAESLDSRAVVRRRHGRRHRRCGRLVRAHAARRRSSAFRVPRRATPSSIGRFGR